MPKTNKLILLKYLFEIFMCAMPLIAASQSTKKIDLPPDTSALVDGVAIKKTTIDKAYGSLAAGGVKPSPEIRNEILQQLVLREVLSAEAGRRGVERKADFQSLLSETKQRLLAESLLGEFSTQNPVTDKEIVAEYERQKTSIGGESATQFKLSQIVLGSEQEARDAINRIRKGEAFDKLASAISTDPASKAKSGELGWFLPMELSPVFGNVIVNLTKGGITAAPIFFSNQWFVIRVDDTRPFKAPSLEESRPRLQSALQQQKRQKFIDDLVKKASIQIGTP